VTTLGFGSILIVRGLIITGTGSIWLVVRRRRRKERIEASEASSGVNIEMMMMMMNNRGVKEEDHN
jgi:hypothetical protein